MTSPADVPARRRFDIVVIGASAGGVHALGEVLHALPADFPLPVAIVQHRSTHAPLLLARVLARHSAIPVRQVTADGEPIVPGVVYLARPDLHLLVGTRDSFALLDGTKIRYLRSAANPLFESAARAFDGRVLAVVLTGGGYDATDGVQSVKSASGIVIAQDEATSEQFSMPRSAIATGSVDYVLPLEQIGPAIAELALGAAGAPSPLQPTPTPKPL